MLEKFSVCLSGSKCGIPQVWGLTDRSLRIVGGAEATYGSHPWLVGAPPFLPYYSLSVWLSSQWLWFLCLSNSDSLMTLFPITALLKSLSFPVHQRSIQSQAIKCYFIRRKFSLQPYEVFRKRKFLTILGYWLLEFDTAVRIYNKNIKYFVIFQGSYSNLLSPQTNILYISSFIGPKDKE